MIEPEKPKKKKLKQNYPKKLGTENIENIIEKKPATTLESFVSDDYSPASKFVPSTPGKKRRQQQKPVYDESQLEKRVRQGIIAQTPRTQILDYLQKKMGCDNKTAEDFLIGIVYDSIKTALWAEKPAPKNTINYLSRGRQLELAKEYIIKNSIFETTGLRRLDSIKESLLRYLSIEEEKIDDLIDERREEYFENFEKEEPATIISEEPITINKNKQVIVTNHIQKRAYQRIGFGANNALFLIDLFHSGMSIAYSYDNNLHRIVEFAGKKYRMPYAETDDAYHLVTIIKIQKK